VNSRVDEEKGVALMRAIRAGVERPGDVYIYLIAGRPVRQLLLDDIDKLVKLHMGEETISIVKASQSALILPITKKAPAMPGLT
jgi:hypothetical protein